MSLIGFVGLLISTLYNPSEITITDQESHIQLIEDNIILNDNVKCKSLVFDWLSFESQSAVKYDIILGLEW